MYVQMMLRRAFLPIQCSLGRPLGFRMFGLLGAIALTTFAAAANEPNSLEDQLRLQEELLSRLGNDAAVTAKTGATDAGESQLRGRLAPRTPVDRDYPPAIFDETTVVIPPGRWGNRDRQILTQRVLDADRDGKPEVQQWINPESQLPVRQVEDKNYDGIQDTWSNYQWGAVVSRTLDSNDDGNPDVWEKYAGGHMTSREVDRDDDGVRDAFYRYKGDSLVGESHDANNDGTPDLLIVYEKRRRVRSEEDVDRDKRIDTWTFFSPGSGPEVALRIDRDTLGRGTPDTAEFFSDDNGTALIERREQDVNGDGDVDIISVYKKGKLVRREIYDVSLATES